MFLDLLSPNYVAEAQQAEIIAFIALIAGTVGDQALLFCASSALYDPYPI